MNLLRLFTVLPVIAALTVVTDVAARSPELSLPMVIQAGLAQYPETALPAALRQQGQAIRDQSSSLLAADPSVFLRHESDAINNNDGFRKWEGGVAMPLWMPGQRDKRLRVADATEQEAEALVRLQHWRLAGEVRELLWSVVIAAAEVSLAEQAQASAEKIEADVRHRVAVGELARSEIIIVRKETLARQAALATANFKHQTLLGQYRILTGLQELPTQFEEAVPADTSIPDDHPLLTAMRVAATRARSERDQVASERRGNPTLMLGGQSERADSNMSYDTSVILEVSLPLGLRSHSAPASAAAERNLTKANIDVARMRLDLKNKLINARNTTASSERAAELAGEQLELGEAGLQLTQRAFELGESDLFSLLLAHKQALTSRHDSRISQLELGQARARLNQILGVIPE